PRTEKDRRKGCRELTADGLSREPIVTETTAATPFYPAEDYHQEYFARNPYQPYASTWSRPRWQSSGSTFSSA
ncbi:MAG: peptide-methionine (S)-S-oxide reductase, partial [Burkholderiales bacterium]